MSRERTASSRSGLFLMELIIAIAFFAVASAICIQMFATAHTLNRRSSDVNKALISAQSAAECFKASGGDIDATALLLNAQTSGESLELHYDSGWNPVPDGDGRYTLSLARSGDTDLGTATITVTDNARGDTLFELTAQKYRPS